MRQFFMAMTRNPMSMVGVAICTAAGALIATLFTIELIGFVGNPYIGIITYLILPAVLVFGLLLIPWGIARDRKRRISEGATARPRAFPVLDLNRDRTRRLVLTFLLITVINIVILATATFKGVEVMESNEFCGTTCHTVMQPEYTAYQRSPHSRVHCVDCHIGPGADWFVKSKLSGAWQVISATFELYPKPISTPVHDLRPARETCEQCHWPEKFVGDKLRVGTHYSTDESNTETKNVLLLRIGGRLGKNSQGIHWHVDRDHTIRYRSDASREKIFEVELTGPDGVARTFLPSDPPQPGEELEWRTMDCVDCHNRPSHIYRSAEREIDMALESGQIATDLPFVRREAARVLNEANYASHEEARTELPLAFEKFYASEYPQLLTERSADLAAASSAVVRAYTSNVFPKMALNWNTYPNHIGHENSPGCFRCHNDEHATDAGELISQDCDTCHTLLALEEEDPEILKELLP